MSGYVVNMSLAVKSLYSSEKLYLLYSFRNPVQEEKYQETMRLTHLAVVSSRLI